LVFDGFIRTDNTESFSGGSDDDVFRPFDGVVVAGSIDGGGGNDTLDYVFNTNPITANLQTGAATNIAAGITHIENLNGGKAADTLIGDAGNNTLTGHEGDDTLDGG